MNISQCIDHLLRSAATQRDLSDWVDRLSADNLVHDISVPYVVSSWLCQCLYGSYPEIVSGYRSPERQLELIDAWNAGDRFGLIARPASKSWHMQGRAIDVRIPASEAMWSDFIMFMKAFGTRWGGDFRATDPVHFDAPGPKQYTAAQLIVRGRGGELA